MPEPATIARAKRKAKEGKAPSTQAGEFVREEIHHIREGKHGARSAKQAIAIGLSKARKAGVELPPPPGEKSNRHNERHPQNKPSARRSRATLSALQKEPRASASHEALARQAHKSAVKRGFTARHKAAMKAVHTKGPVVRPKAQKAARTRAAAH